MLCCVELVSPPKSEINMPEWCVCYTGTQVCLFFLTGGTQAVQGKLLGVSDLALRLYAVVKHETREEYA